MRVKQICKIPSMMILMETSMPLTTYTTVLKWDSSVFDRRGLYDWSTRITETKQYNSYGCNRIMLVVLIVLLEETEGIVHFFVEQRSLSDIWMLITTIHQICQLQVQPKWSIQYLCQLNTTFSFVILLARIVHGLSRSEHFKILKRHDFVGCGIIWWWWITVDAVYLVMAFASIV